MNPKDEIEDAYLTIGICIRAKMNELCNIRRFDEAFELEKAYKTINKYTNNALDWKTRENK